MRTKYSYKDIYSIRLSYKALADYCLLAIYQYRKSIFICLLLYTFSTLLQAGPENSLVKVNSIILSLNFLPTEVQGYYCTPETSTFNLPSGVNEISAQVWPSGRSDRSIISGSAAFSGGFGSSAGTLVNGVVDSESANEIATGEEQNGSNLRTSTNGDGLPGSEPGDIGNNFQVHWMTPASNMIEIIPGSNFRALVSGEICNNGIDDDGDGLIDCGDPDCTSCLVQNCDNGVKVISKKEASASGSGAGGMASLTNFFIPEGNNRIVFIAAAFERIHCQFGDNCTSSSSTTLGDNFAAPNFVAKSGIDMQMTIKMTGPGGSQNKLNPLILPAGDLRFGSQFGGVTTNAALAVASREMYFFAFYESEINTLLAGAPSGNVTISFVDALLPKDAADESLIIAHTFINAQQNASGIVRSGIDATRDNLSTGGSGYSGNYTMSVSDIDNGQEPNEINDGFLVVAMNGTEGYGFNTISGFNNVSYISRSNTASSNFTTLQESDGATLSSQFRNGPTSGIINSVTIQSSAPSSPNTNGGMMMAFTIESCKFEICNNGIDDDGDGLIDCADTDCNPIASSAGPVTMCHSSSTNLSVTVSGGTGPFSYLWSPSIGLSANNISNPIATPSATTIYIVTVTSSSGCTATSSRVVNINVNPTATISGTNTICSGSNTTFTASGGSTYLWSTTATTAAIIVSMAGTYTVTVTNASGCTATATSVLTVNANPTASISGTNTICAGGSTTFTASGGTSYLWSTTAITAAI
ncbi:MAG: PKD domain-containing protein, partial [Saprospiraceae bacterium]